MKLIVIGILLDNFDEVDHNLAHVEEIKAKGRRI